VTLPPLPLDGVRVLEASQVMAGPYCALLLADMGADVVKVEKPRGGDDSRRMGPPFINGESAAFLAINRNKRSVALDLKQPAGQEVFRRLADRADILVENFRPGTLGALGLGYTDLAAEHPELIYCSISGYGQTGPDRERGGYDLVAQGAAGLMSITGHPGQPPVKVGVPVADLNAGMYAAYGVLCAYIHRLKTGQGQYVDTSLLEGGLAYTVWESAMFFATGVTPPPMGSAHRLAAPYQAFKTSDGYITIGAANQANWELLCEALGRLELVADPRYADNPARTRAAPELARELEPAFALRSTREWLERMEAVGLPAGPVNDMAAVYADPQIQARSMMVELDHPTAGRIKHIGVPVKLSRTPGSVRRPAPTLGQHSDEILAEAGLAPAEIGALRADRVIG
jgi:crotonobetainyl-CoA:carnitine CoA-transferase CaiB-like acyl-CoA transferase